MATPKKAVTKKAATKKAVATKASTAAAKKPELNVVEGPIQFNVKESKNIEMIGKNQDRIVKAAVGLLDIAQDTGMRLLALKDAIKKHGGKWKIWGQEEGNLPFGYEQATRYMKLAQNPEQFAIVKADGVTSIEEAVKQIEYIKKPEKAAAAEVKAAAKAAAPKLVPWTLSAVVDVLTTLAVEDLRELQGFIADRIEELEQAEVDAGDDADEDEVADDAVEAESEALAELS